MSNEHANPTRRRRSVVQACIAAAVLAAVGLLPQTSSPAYAASPHHVKITLREAPIRVTEGPSPEGPPTRAIEAGLFTSSIGNGANRTDVRVLEGVGTRTFFNRHGSIHGRFVFHGDHTPTGDTIVGTLTVTRGTGRYSGVQGALHINGFHDDASAISVEHLEGTLTY